MGPPWQCDSCVHGCRSGRGTVPALNKPFGPLPPSSPLPPPSHLFLPALHPQALPAAIFSTVGMLQMVQWALQKHKRLRKVGGAVNAVLLT